MTPTPGHTGNVRPAVAISPELAAQLDSHRAQREAEWAAYLRGAPKPTVAQIEAANEPEPVWLHLPSLFAGFMAGAVLWGVILMIVGKL